MLLALEKSEQPESYCKLMQYKVNSKNTEYMVVPGFEPVTSRASFLELNKSQLFEQTLNIVEEIVVCDFGSEVVHPINYGWTFMGNVHPTMNDIIDG